MRIHVTPVTVALPLALAAGAAGCSQGYVELPHHDAGERDGAVSEGGAAADGSADASSGDAARDAGPDAGDGGAPGDAPSGTDGGGDAASNAPRSDGAVAGPEVWVVRLGAAGAASPPDSTATATFIDRFGIADGAPRGAIALPVAASGANQPLTTSGSSTSEGALTRSADGKSVVLAGYAAAPGTGDVHADGAVTSIRDTPTTGAGAVLRVVGRVDAAGAVDTSFTTAAYSGNDVRGAATVDGTAYWMFGDGSGASGGISYQAASGAAPTFVSTSVATVRVAGVFGGRLYGTSSTGNVHGVFTMTSALPTTAENASSLAGFPSPPGPSPYGFAALALGATSDVDTLYVCDDRSSASGGGVQRWKLSGGAWTLATTFTDGMSGGCRGIAATAGGGAVTLFVTTTEASGNHLLKLVDTAAGLPTATAANVADAPANTVFRGVAIAPN